jgi:hypothetical protein
MISLKGRIEILVGVRINKKVRCRPACCKRGMIVVNGLSIE